MRFNQSEIIEDILEHIRQGGGEFSDWCVGSAKDSQCASFGRHVNEDSKDGLLYREAYTTYAAEEVLERLVKGCGLRPERAAVPQTGRIVFVYRSRESMNAEGSGQEADGSGQEAVGRGQKAVGRGQKAVGRGQKAVGRGQKAVGRRQMAVGRRQMAVGRRQKAEGSGQKAEGRRQWAEGRWRWTEGRRRWTEGRRQWAEGRGQKADGGGQKAEGGGQKAEGGGQKAEGGGQKAEGSGQKAEGSGQKAEPAGRDGRARTIRRPLEKSALFGDGDAPFQGFSAGHHGMTESVPPVAGFDAGIEGRVSHAPCGTRAYAKGEAQKKAGPFGPALRSAYAIIILQSRKLASRQTEFPGHPRRW